VIQKTKILLVDDEPIIVKTVQKRLEVEGYEVLVAADGLEALEKTRTLKPDLIVLDLMLPKMDGYQVCGRLKKDPRYSKIPIVMYTARAQEVDVKLGLECGADAYIKKPFNSRELLDKIKALLVKTPSSLERS
jgi:DNA-binding response OmpR family regulator